MAAGPAHMVDGGIRVHPLMKQLFPKLVDQGGTAATRPYDVGGQQLPHVVATLSALYPMAANLSAVGYLGLTAGAAPPLPALRSAGPQPTVEGPVDAGRGAGTVAPPPPRAG